MSLKEYLINSILEEKEIVTELLYIDNKVQYMNLTYEELLNKISSVEIYNDFDNNLIYNAITDGEVESVVRVLISVSNLKNIYVNRTSLAINKYLVERTNMYYEDKNIVLAINSDYNSYKDDKIDIVICAFDEMKDNIVKDFTGRNLVIMK